MVEFLVDFRLVVELTADLAVHLETVHGGLERGQDLRIGQELVLRRDVRVRLMGGVI
jgi:hypothetical protein